MSIAEIAIKCSSGKLTVEGDLLLAVKESGLELLDFTAAEPDERPAPHER